MCGLTGWMMPAGSTWRPSKEIIKFWLQGIEHRGRDATGYFTTLNEPTADGNTFFWMKGPKTVKEFLPEIEHADTPVGRIGMLHTRSFTVGSPFFNKNNHPIVLDKTVITHNGGFPSFREGYKKLGIEDPVAEVDSAIIAHAIRQLGPQPAMQFLVDEAPGMAAIVAYLGNHGNDILMAQDGRPLYLGRLPEGGYMWSSEAEVCANTHSPADAELLWLTAKFPKYKYILFDGETLKIKDHGGFMLKLPAVHHINAAHTSGLVEGYDSWGFKHRGSSTFSHAAAERRVRLCEWGKCTDPGTKTVQDADGTQKLVCKPHKRQWIRGMSIPTYSQG